MGELYNVWSFLTRHKIVIAIVVVVLLVGFVDENSLWQRRARRENMKELRAKIAQFRSNYERDSIALHKLETSRDEVVRVAREDYYMCRSNEDIFVVKSDQPVDTVQSMSENERVD